MKQTDRIQKAIKSMSRRDMVSMLLELGEKMNEDELIELAKMKNSQVEDKLSELYRKYKRLNF